MKKLIVLFLLFFLFFSSCVISSLPVNSSLKIEYPKDGDIINFNIFEIIIAMNNFSPFAVMPSRVDVYFANYTSNKKSFQISNVIQSFTFNIDFLIPDGEHVLFFETFTQDNILISKHYIRVKLDR